jgi:valyl-tRNA synthetase
MYRLAFNKFSSQPPKKVKLASYLKVARQLHDKPLHEAMAAKLDPAQIADSYLPYDVESYWVDWWRKEGFFHGQEERVNKGGKKPYTIVLPPPNVTGYLHIGHALTSSIQDALCRWRRMQGYEVCYLPGTDHAGIATQTVVEKELMKL